MQAIELKHYKNNVKVGQETPDMPVNISESCLFMYEGKIVGFYIQEMSERMCELATVANKLLRTSAVPKTEMQRPKMLGIDQATGKGIVDRSVKQYSAILGSLAPKPHMKRNYPTISSVHSYPSAQDFIKVMLLLAYEGEELIRQYMPEQFDWQLKTLEHAEDKWRFGRLFTSAICNYNISAPYHRDTGNTEGAVNLIITKRDAAIGGCLHVPDFNITIKQQNDSCLVYPAYMNIHGVTPIHRMKSDGYRNTLIFYSLKYFTTK